MKAFRLETITFDRDERVRDVTVVVDAPYLAVIAGHLGVSSAAVQNCVINRGHGNTELWIRLDVAAALKLRESVGVVPSNRPSRIDGAYDSLGLVERLVESEEDR